MSFIPGYLYFIKDTSFNNHSHKDLKANKPTDTSGNIHNRPCYYAFDDNGVLWMVPVSSQVTKYKKIYKQKAT